MYGLKHLSPAISSSYIYLQPVLVMFFAVILSAIGVADDYTNTITIEKIIYMLLIFMGVYIISRKKQVK
jgi:drug/metabolite transporter (DMT)-like permease